jgi:hypothetical protein
MARWHGNFFDNIFLVQAAAYFFQCLHLEAPNTMYNNLMWGIYYFLFKIQNSSIASRFISRFSFQILPCKQPENICRDEI